MPDSYRDPNFTPLDHSELNDLRRRVVSNEPVSDEELKHAIQTCLYSQRELDVKAAAPKKKAARKPSRTKKLDPSVNFDDLLNKPISP